MIRFLPSCKPSVSNGRKQKKFPKFFKFRHTMQGFAAESYRLRRSGRSKNSLIYTMKVVLQYKASLI
ncbi:hypothetical protein, partial [Comamonas terrigena]|uniref:hypothetical protein n=1 Tax=Comamonas terrigena TaxID=32013 RepID=UPI0024488F10